MPFANVLIKGTTIGTCRGRQDPRIRTYVTSKVNTSKIKSGHIPPRVVQPKQTLSTCSRSPSPNREPWYKNIIH